MSSRLKCTLLITGVLTAMAIPAGAAELATASLQQTNTSPFTYALTVNDTGTTTVGTFWYAWVPGQDFLATHPITITNPTGWQSIVTGGGAGDGFAIQWKATTAASDIAAGFSLSGFGFTSADNLASVSGNSSFFPTTPVGTSFVYSGAPFSDAGFQFVTSTPEPATLGLLGLPAWAMMRRRRTH